jgi:hypothetical protein
MHTLTIRYSVVPKARSLTTGKVADLFGLTADEPPHTVVQDLELDVQPNELVLLTGPSGSGKSSILRALGEQLQAVDALSLPLPECPLVEALSLSFEESLALLTQCGLGEARLLLRTPTELSDGQRYRFRMALALATGRVVLLDEFAAVLDRTLAKVVAFNLRRSVSRRGVGALCATTHDDLVNDLQPDVWLHCHGDGTVQVTRGTAKKNESALMINSGSVRAPVPTGRTSLGGITAATTSAL